MRISLEVEKFLNRYYFVIRKVRNLFDGSVILFSILLILYVYIYEMWC